MGIYAAGVDDIFKKMNKWTSNHKTYVCIVRTSLTENIFTENTITSLPNSEIPRSTSKIVEWEKKKRAKRIKNVLQCPMC